MEPCRYIYDSKPEGRRPSKAKYLPQKEQPQTSQAQYPVRPSVSTSRPWCNTEHKRYLTLRKRIARCLWNSCIEDNKAGDKDNVAIACAEDDRRDSIWSVFRSSSPVSHVQGTVTGVSSKIQAWKHLSMATLVRDDETQWSHGA